MKARTCRHRSRTSAATNCCGATNVGVKITVLLADYAKADQQGKITAVGLGWKTCPTPVPPHAVVIYLDIGWDETDQPHKLTADLLTADGAGVAVSGPLGVQRFTLRRKWKRVGHRAQFTAPKRVLL